MEPYRETIERAPEPPPSQPAARELEPSFELQLLRLYRRRFLTVTALAWLGSALALALVGAPFLYMLLFSLLWAGVVVAELVHALVYLAPILGFWRARAAVRRRLWGTDVEGWVVVGSAPRWPLWTIPLSMLVSLVGHELGGLPGLACARVLYLFMWIPACWFTAKRVSILRRTKGKNGRRVFELEDFDARRQVDVEGIDLEATEVHLFAQGERFSLWAVGPLETLIPDRTRLPPGSW